MKMNELVGQLCPPADPTI